MAGCNWSILQLGGLSYNGEHVFAWLQGVYATHEQVNTQNELQFMQIPAAFSLHGIPGPHQNATPVSSVQQNPQSLLLYSDSESASMKKPQATYQLLCLF